MANWKKTARGALAGCAVTAVIVLFRRWYMGTDVALDAPLFMLFVPIVTAAWLGDWRSGLFATALVALVSYWLFVPRMGWQVIHSVDQVRLLRLIFVGGLLSLLFQVIHVNRQGLQLSVAELLRSWRRLAQANENLQLVTEEMAAYVFRCSRDLHYLWVSKQYAEWVGRPIEQIVGQPIVEILGDEAFSQLTPHFKEVLAGRRVEYEDLVNFDSRGQRWIHAVYTPTLDADGCSDGWVGVVFDVTDRKSIEQQLQEADRRKDEYLALLAHELRNPLAPICNALAVLPLVRDHPSEVSRIGETVERQVQHMVRIVDDLLDVARITRGKLHLRQEYCDLRRVAEDAVMMVRPLVEQRRHRLLVTMPPEAVNIRGDVTRLTQAIGNVLHNAAKFTAPGGTISLNLAHDGPQAIVQVRDDGEGIPPAMLSGIFDMFCQVDQSASRAHGGVGIGLTLARQIANLHGGQLEARSEGLGRGSEFCLALPVAEKVASNVPEPHVPAVFAAEPGMPRRVLVVDDIAAAGESLAELLELRGHDVRLVDNGMAAIETMLAEPPDVALIDLGMPGMDGYEVARRLRAVPQLDHVALVALTGYGGPEIRQRVSEVGFDGHITKPAPLAELEELLDSLPVRRRLRSQTSPMLR